MTDPLIPLLEQVRACRLCEDQLPLGPRPVIRGLSTATLLIIGQAPGTKVHASGVPWDDPSGRRLRQWLAISDQQFYDEARIAIMPMGLCYPGRGNGGDLPPMPRCAPIWHPPVLAHLQAVQLVLLIGDHAQRYYLKDRQTLSQRVAQWPQYGPRYFPLPHPSPRNQRWLRERPWFEQEVVPALRDRVATALAAAPGSGG